MNHEELEHWGRPRLILVATNLADRQGLALQAVAQARRAGAGILLVHVLRPASLRTALDPQLDSPIVGSRIAAAWEVIHRTAKGIEWQGVPCETSVIEGDPVEEIPRLVETRSVDRVIVATRSARGFSRLFQGSVAEALMMTVTVPVCVIGPCVAISPLSDTTGGRVLLALSLHHPRSFYLDFAAELARVHRASLAVLHILDVAGLTNAERNEAHRTAQAVLNEAIAATGSTAVRAEVVLREGDPASRILEERACPGRDFIVMGAASLSVMSKLLGSSVVHRVLSEVQCPVITLRDPDAARNKALADKATETRAMAA